MNRTLRRPMFRIGGSAEGITSGLSRQGYATNEDNLVKQNDFSKMKVSDLGDMNLGQLQELSKSMSYKPRGTNVYDFMTEFGLDLVSRPASGSIFQQAATSAQKPYERFMERKKSAAEQAYGSESDMFKTMMGGAFDVMAAKEEGKASGKGWLKQWENEQIPILNRTIRDLTKKQDNGTITADEELELQSAIEQKRGIVDIDEVTSAFLKTEEGGELVVDTMEILLEKDLQIEDPEKRKYPKRKKDVQLYLDAIEEVKRRLGMAKGGRVGYQNAGPVMPGQPMQAAGPTDQGAEVPEELQNIDYDTLRTRLPASITDDIVRLIASSAEAMEDFATIQTQQDINNFNQKYGVELVLPAEA
jgi:hypothetical protein